MEIKSRKLSLTKIEGACEEVCQILKSLSHPQRLLIMGHLLGGEKTVSELVEVCEISQSQMSQFLVRMKVEGLIDSRREGKYQFYRVEDKRLLRLMRVLQDEFCQ